MSLLINRDALDALRFIANDVLTCPSCKRVRVVKRSNRPLMCCGAEMERRKA